MSRAPVAEDRLEPALGAVVEPVATPVGEPAVGGAAAMDPVAGGPDRDVPTIWTDRSTQQALQVIAEGITRLAGFDVAVISVVREGQQLQVTAVAGSEDARRALHGASTPIDQVLDELEHAERWGHFRFVAQEDLDPDLPAWGWVPDLVPLDGPDAWQPMDLLVAPLYGKDGELCGTLSIDCPSEGRRPDAAHRRILDRYAEQAVNVLLVAIERESFAEQVRILSTTRDVVRDASQEPNIAGMLERIQPNLVVGFKALGTWVHTFDEDGHGLGAIYAANGAHVEMPDPLVAIAERAAADAWRAQRVGIVGRYTEYADARVTNITEPEFEQILAFLEGQGVGSLLFVPLGAGTECLGSLVLTRGLDDPPWSSIEIDAALEVGRDLGRALLNVRTLEREREIVSELTALDAYKSKLIATLSHELKSPLAAMLANIELLAQVVDLDTEALGVLAAVDRGAARLVRVVEDLLLLARVGDPGLVLLRRAVYLPDVVVDVVGLVAVTDQLRITVEVLGEELGQVEDVVVAGDPVELDILVTNLVSNAIKYSGEDSPVVVRLWRADDEVVLECVDRGIGIADADRAHLFREFFRSEDNQVKSKPGTGLGLTIVDRIVTRHGGRIEVDSVLGEGSTFRVLLPIA